MYTRFITYLGDKKGAGTIRIMLPYFQINNSYNYEILANYDFVIPHTYDSNNKFRVIQFQRSATDDQLYLIKSLKKQIEQKSPETKIFYDIDDYILDIPKYNDSRNYYEKYKDNIKKILSIVDCIACSTVELQKYMKEFNKTIIIKNRLIKPLWTPIKKEVFKYKRKTILWAGGAQHFSTLNDDGDFDKEIIEYINQTSKIFEWIFVGSIPKALKNNREIQFLPWTKNYFNYVEKLKYLQPDIGIALLKDNKFNQCKSNIKALEFAALNIPGIYSDITPYKNMKLRVRNTDDFIHYVKKLTSDDVFYTNMLNRDQETLRYNLYWDEEYTTEYIKKYLGI